MKNSNVERLQFNTTKGKLMINRKEFFTLFDRLNFKQNIVLYFFRIGQDSLNLLTDLAYKNNYQIIKDQTRKDCILVFIPSLKNHNEIKNLFKELDPQTEVTYFKNNIDLATFLFNWERIKKTNSVELNLSIFQANLCQEEFSEIYYNPDYFNNEKIMTILSNLDSEMN